MIKKEMIAMLLAGGQGSRLGVLTAKMAKPAVSFGGKYRIIDFPLSNCINSGVDTVGVLTQYRYIEEITLEEFLNRTSFEAYENMPFYFKMAFAIDLFEKNTIYTVQ